MALVKNIAMMRRKPGTTREEFRRYYEERHVPLAMKIIGSHLVDYRRNYNMNEYVAEDYSRFGESAAPDRRPNQSFGEFDAMSEYWYNADTMAEVIKTVEQQRAIIVADEDAFMDRSSLRIFSVEEALTDMTRWR